MRTKSGMRVHFEELPHRKRGNTIFCLHTVHIIKMIAMPMRGPFAQRKDDTCNLTRKYRCIENIVQYRKPNVVLDLLYTAPRRVDTLHLQEEEEEEGLNALDSHQ